MKKIIKYLKQFGNYFFIGFAFLGNQKIVAVLTICLFVSLLNVSTGYREELLQQEQKMMFEKSPSEVKYYNAQANSSSTSTIIAAEQLSQCYKSALTSDTLPALVQEKITQLNEFYNQNDQYFSFLYRDLYTGFTVSYNEKAPIFTASTIKAPAMIYLYEQASLGNIDLNEKLTYTSNFYSGGSGVLKSKVPNTKYSVQELINYAIHDSDNIAYAMLMNRYKRENVLDFWSKLNTDYIFTLDTIWGVTSASDAAIYMQELYRFFKENKDYGVPLMEKFKNAEWKMISNQHGEWNTANKGGWSGTAIHDAAIVFEKNPYILIIMSNTGESNYLTLFQTTNRLVGELHERYWQHKEESCQTIKQY